MNRNSATHVRSQRGFSLVEVLTATAIFAIIFVAALMMYDRSNRVYKQGVEAADMQQSTRVAFDKLVSDLRMTGFDFDRDGTPTSTLASTWQATSPYSLGNLVEPVTPNGYVYRCTAGGTSGPSEPAWSTTPGTQTNDTGGSVVTWQIASEVQYQQPDEQVEYAGRALVGIRANFDYDLELGPCSVPGTPCENGREDAYQTDSYPVVTTGNDEIVLYALRPVNPPLAALPQLSLFADMTKPRNVSIGTGLAEQQINLPRVYDPCDGPLADSATTRCANPPYTLYRISFEDATGVGLVETPIAENIRSMDVKYYRDAAATDEIPADTLPNGAGKWDGNDPYATIDERDLRTEIRAIRLNLVGMNPQPDGSYTDPNVDETVVRNHRKYQLETLVVPRNIGRRGMREFNTNTPGAPTLDTVCAGSCNAVYVAWSAATTGGGVESYNILYDVDNGVAGSQCSTAAPSQVVNLTFAEDAGRNLEGYASMWITPGQTYFFAVQAINRHGTATSNCYSILVENTTKPEAPATLSASGAGALAAQPNQISVYWPPVTENDDSFKTVPCSPMGARDTKIMPTAEKRYYRLFKSKNIAVDPTAADTQMVLHENSTDQPSFDGTNMVFVDTKTANCLTYYYRIETVDHCYQNDAWNAGGSKDRARSADFYPPLGNDGIPGAAFENLVPAAAPQGFAVTNANCTAGLCDVTFAWSAVTKDDGAPAGPDITIDRYEIRAEQNIGGTWQAAAAPLITPTAFTGGVLTGTISNVPEMVENRFFIQGVDCIPGVESTPAYYPCSFGGGTVTITAPVNYGGDGSAGAPWVTEAPATIEVQTQNAVRRIEATFSQNGAPVGATFSTSTTPISSAVIPIPDIADGVPALVAITVTDDSTSGCAFRYEYWVIDEPTPLCSLLDRQSNPGILTWPTAGNDRVATIQLRNTAGDPLIIQKVYVRWTRSTSNNFADRLVSANFSTGLVTLDCDRSNTEITVPTGTVLAGNGTETMTLLFRRARFNRAIATNPISSICVQYQAPGGDVLACSISPAAGTCGPLTGNACY